MNIDILRKDFKTIDVLFRFYEKSKKIIIGFPFKIIVVSILLVGLYHQLYGYKDRYYNIDELKYFLILDKNAKLSNMRCRSGAKYSFEIKTNPINQNKLIDIFIKNGWEKYQKYGTINLMKQNVKISISISEKYITNLNVRLLWQ